MKLTQHEMEKGETIMTKKTLAIVILLLFAGVVIGTLFNVISTVGLIETMKLVGGLSVFILGPLVLLWAAWEVTGYND